MEGVAPFTKQELASKLVQAIAKKGDEIPEDFLHKDGFPEAIDAPELWRDDLLIDFSLLPLYSAPKFAKLKSAICKWGCFQVINHGIEVSFLEELIKTAKQFFALPLEEKLNYTTEDDIVQGYGTDSAYSGSQTRNWNDRLFLFLHPKERLRLECWPQKPEKLREMIEEYSKQISTINKVLCKAMSRSLGLEESCLLEFGKHGSVVVRFNYQPRCPYPEHILGTKPHTDNGIITYLFPEVEGLQILNDGQWYKVLVIPGALFINLGELGEALTNGMFTNFPSISWVPFSEEWSIQNFSCEFNKMFIDTLRIRYLDLST